MVRDPLVPTAQGPAGDLLDDGYGTIEIEINHG